MDQLPRLRKREQICLQLFTCYYVISVGEVSSSSGCFGWNSLFYCGTPSAFHIIIFQKYGQIDRLKKTDAGSIYHCIRLPTYDKCAKIDHFLSGFIYDV